MIQDPITDVLGAPYLAEVLDFPPDDEGEVVATLVRRAADAPTRKAVLHVHGFADYFFHTEYAEWWTARGYDFYALDLRKYGRSIRPHQTPNYVTDLREYYAELDEAWFRITQRDGHDHVVASGHSTGGLTLPLWADDRRPPALAAMVLNSPWFDLHGSFVARNVATIAAHHIGRHRPLRELRRNVTGFYARSLHRDHEGEWDFDLAWKPLKSWPAYAGWLRAIRHGHARLQKGLEIGCPALVLSSGATRRPVEFGPDVHTHDLVLDVPQIRRWATAIGRHVTYVAVEGARHDVVLSLSEPRARVYDELDRWLTAYVD